jgi:folate-binding protein YgfZ
MDVVTVDPGYAAATESVALLDRSERGKLAVSGPEAAAFLDSLLSNEIAGLQPGSGTDATLLTHKGRMLAEVRVLASEDELLLDTERVALQALFDALRQYRIGYRAELHKRTLERGLLSLIGPSADAVLPEPPGPAEHDHRASALAGHEVRVIRTDLGIDVLCASEHTAGVADALARAGALPIGEAVAETVRIERGRPRFGVELDEDTMPQEAGLHERAVSYAKGCYVGQETVARLYWKGKPNRHLRGLRFSAEAPPGAALLLGEQRVGAVASVARSPRLGPIGLAIVRREAAPGALLAVEGAEATATVVELPFANGG